MKFFVYERLAVFAACVLKFVRGLKAADFKHGGAARTGATHVDQYHLA